MSIALVTGLALSTVVLLTRSPRSLITEADETKDANQQSQQAERIEPGVDRPAPSTPVRKLASVTPPTPDQANAPAADVASQFASLMQVRADRVLAKVNDQPILLKHLVPLQPDALEQTMTAEEYASRLNRAIETELAFQAAATRGVELTPAQKKRVDSVARRHEATLREYGKQGFTWTTLTVAQVEFEQRLTAALLLQQNLVAREAGVVPGSDAGVQRRYEQALQAMLARMKTASAIRTDLSSL